MTPSTLQDLRIVVTGGTAGLGRALIAELLSRGARVAFVARHAASRRARRRASARHSSASLATSRARRRFIPLRIQALGALGGLDVLVNNASSLGPVPLVAARRH